MDNAVEKLKAQREAYVKEEAQKIIDLMTKYNETTWTKHTCDHSNSDTKLHAHFPQIAAELRKQGFTVTSKVNWGVTDWQITI
jgi:hypothetical protein